MNTSQETVVAKFFNGELLIEDFMHPAWNAAVPVIIEHYWSGEPAPAGRRAAARLLWDAEALFVRFDYMQREPLILSANPQFTEKTLGLWERDVCEIFIAPDAALPEHYFEFEAAPTGEWVDLEILWSAADRTTVWDYVSDMSVAAHINREPEAAQVTIVMQIPFTAFRTDAPRAGEIWRANLFHSIGVGRMRYLAWRPTLTDEPNFHVPQAFGDLLWEK